MYQMNTKYINYFLAIFVILVCFIWVYFLVFTDDFMGGLPRMQRRIFIGLLSGYGIYRSYRLYLQIQRDKINDKHINDDENE
jgi:hypothetical protein